MSNWYEWKDGKMRRRTLVEVKAMGPTWRMDDDYGGVILTCLCGFKEEDMDGVYIPWGEATGFFRWTCQCGKEYSGSTGLTVIGPEGEVTAI